jgi:hypothetical protein
MGLSFFNNTPDGLYVCHLRYDPSCATDGGQPFSGHGWYHDLKLAVRQVDALAEHRATHRRT